MNSDDKFFNYDALNLLDDDIDNMSSFINDNSNIKKIIIIPFKINFNCTNPFNTILLINNFTDVLCFPSIDISCYDSELNNSTKILSRIHCYLYSIFLSNSKSGLSNNGFESFLNLIEFKGFYVYENQIHAFVDLTKLEFITNIVNRNSLYWFALFDEIQSKI